MLEYQKELLALRLKEEDVGEHIMLAEVTMWSHIHFHNQLKMVLQDLTMPAPPNWNTFLNEIKDVNVDILQDKVKREKEKKEAERAQNIRIACLESRQHNPVEVLHLQMQQTTLGATAPT
ncbi:hypothetical protein BDR06DRAFT_1003912 [Suillus hirtellus]|nr:hypothetical protein BDR06DRAFT_1003912 [Suillus hirtellus]